MKEANTKIESADATCPKCKVTGNAADLFGYRKMAGVVRRQSYCRKCRSKKEPKRMAAPGVIPGQLLINSVVDPAVEYITVVRTEGIITRFPDSQRVPFQINRSDTLEITDNWTRCRGWHDCARLALDPKAAGWKQEEKGWRDDQGRWECLYCVERGRGEHARIDCFKKDKVELQIGCGDNQLTTTLTLLQVKKQLTPPPDDRILKQFWEYVLKQMDDRRKGHGHSVHCPDCFVPTIREVLGWKPLPTPLKETVKL